MTLTLLSSLAMTISSSIAVSSPTPCNLWSFVGIVSLLTGLVFDTLLSFDGLLVFLVSSIALTLFATPLLTTALGSATAIAAVTLFKVYGAYKAFMALAPGSLPSSGAGFWRATQIARCRSFAHGAGFLQSMSLRPGASPYTIRTVAHRQVNQQSPGDVQQYFGDRLALFAALQSDDSSSVSSSSDSAISALFGSCGCISSPDLRTFGCSTCSPQRSSSGAHVILHPSDCEQVVQNGWGEVHPLANTSCPFSRSSGNPCLPGTLTLVYAPREYSEVCTVMGIIEAGSKYLASLDGKTIEAN